MLAVALLLIAGEGASVVVDVRGGGDAPCAATIDGRAFDPATIATADLARSAGEARRADVRIAPDTVYRCAGPVIYRLQQAGYTLTFSGTAEKDAR